MRKHLEELDALFNSKEKIITFVIMHTEKRSLYHVGKEASEWQLLNKSKELANWKMLNRTKDATLGNTPDDLTLACKAPAYRKIIC